MSARVTFDQQDDLASLLRATGVLNYSFTKPCHRHGALNILAGAGVIPSPEPDRQYKRKTISHCHGAQGSYSSWSMPCNSSRSKSCYQSCTVDDEDACIEEFLLNRENSSKRLWDSSSSGLSPATPASGCSLGIKPPASSQGNEATVVKIELDGQLYEPSGTSRNAADNSSYQTAVHLRPDGSAGVRPETGYIGRDGISHLIINSSGSCVGSGQDDYMHSMSQTRTQTTTGRKQRQLTSSTVCCVPEAGKLPSSLAGNLSHAATLSCRLKQQHTYTAALCNRSKSHRQLGLRTTGLPTIPQPPAALVCRNMGSVHLHSAAQRGANQHCQPTSGNKVGRHHHKGITRGPVGVYADALPPVRVRHRIASALAAKAEQGSPSHKSSCASSAQQQGPVMRPEQQLQHVHDSNSTVHVASRVTGSNSQNPKRKSVTGAVSAGKAALLQALNTVTAANYRAAAVLCATAKRATAAAAAPWHGSIPPADNLPDAAVLNMVTSWYLAAEGSEQHYNRTTGLRQGVHDAKQQQQQARQKHLAPAEAAITAEVSSSSAWGDMSASSARCSHGVGYTVLERQDVHSSNTLCNAAPGCNNVVQERPWQQQQHHKQESHAECTQELMLIQRQQKQDSEVIHHVPHTGQRGGRAIQVAMLADAEPLQEFLGVSSIINQLEDGLGGLRLTAKRLSMMSTEEIAVPLRQKYSA